MQAESADVWEQKVALERLDRAMNVMLSELERCIPGTDYPLISGQRRLCREIAAALAGDEKGTRR